MLLMLKLFYASAIATLLVLIVAFGIRTFYEPPQAPEYPAQGFRPFPAPGEPIPAPPDEAQQAKYNEEYKRYEEQRSEYKRTVFVVAALLGIGAIAGAVGVLSPRLDAIRLGLVLGGLLTILYAVIQAGDDLADNPVVIFIVAALGLGLVMTAGYRWLAAKAEGTPG